MPSWAKTLSFILLLPLWLWPQTGVADEDYASKILQAGLYPNADKLELETKIDYGLSPTAKEALHKGIPLIWRLRLEIRRIDRWRDKRVYKQVLPYRLQFHALLNQYEVLTPTEQSEMFLTLNAALSFMANPRDAKPIPADLLKPGSRYKLALKCNFDRESLPVPLRPFSYLDRQWFLSSDWYIWPIPR